MNFNLQFSPLALLPFYIYPPIAFHAISCQIHIDQKQCYLLSIFRRHLPISNIAVLSIPNLYELATTKEGELPFILSDKDNYDFDIKIRCCGFVCFVNDVIECECLRCIFYFRIKEK